MIAMGLEIRELMKDWRSDYAVRERFTSLESIVYPVIEPFGQAVLQVCHYWFPFDSLLSPISIRSIRGRAQS